MLTSQSVKAYSASIVLSDEVPGDEVYQYFYVGSRIVIHLADFDFSLVDSFQDRVDYG